MPTKLSKGTYDVEVVVEQLLVISADVKRDTDSLVGVNSSNKPAFSHFELKIRRKTGCNLRI